MAYGPFNAGGSNGVTSFKGRSGAVVPQSGDYSASDVNAYSKSEVDAMLGVTVVDHTLYLSALFSVADHTVSFNALT